MARFRPLRWLSQAVRRIIQPEPRPESRPVARPSAQPPRASVRPSGPTGQRVTRFYTRAAPSGLASDPVATQLVRDAWLNPDVSPDERTELRAALREWIRDEYNLRFNDVFDWEAWRREMGYT